MDYVMSMIRFLALFASLIIASAAPASSQEDAVQPVLVELFANQNCAACPQAHRTMREVSEARDDVFVLTWVVDYWDYLGEPDPMAMPEAKARQAAYSDWLSLRAPYTPQSIYNGVKECPGPRQKQVVKNIEALSGRDGSSLRLTETGGRISMTGESLANVQLLRIDYLPAGAHETGMVNPVRAVTALDRPTDVTHECQRDCIVLAQSTATGEVLAMWQPKATNSIE